ncbi:hypothetical protein HK405_001842, partial [Cladochytrium tenue]
MLAFRASGTATAATTAAATSPGALASAPWCRLRRRVGQGVPPPYRTLSSLPTPVLPPAPPSAASRIRLSQARSSSARAWLVAGSVAALLATTALTAAYLEPAGSEGLQSRPLAATDTSGIPETVEVDGVKLPVV